MFLGSDKSLAQNKNPYRLPPHLGSGRPSEVPSGSSSSWPGPWRSSWETAPRPGRSFTRRGRPLDGRQWLPEARSAAENTCKRSDEIIWVLPLKCSKPRNDLRETTSRLQVVPQWVNLQQWAHGAAIDLMTINLSYPEDT